MISVYFFQLKEVRGFVQLVDSDAFVSVSSDSIKTTREKPRSGAIIKYPVDVYFFIPLSGRSITQNLL